MGSHRLRGAALLPLVVVAGLAASSSVEAQESPYFVAYDHYLEEPGALELGFSPVYGAQRAGNGFLSGLFEIEYGVKAWWTTELYLDAERTFDEGTSFTGVRWENRFRPTVREHALNPILYVEYEDVNGADKVLKEVVGHDVEADHGEPIADTRKEREREVELKLILSSAVSGWNLSENLVAVRSLSGGPMEFGYALGVSRPLALAASAERCSFCRENFVAGLELYGGLGDSSRFGLEDTSHYVAPVIAWNLPNALSLRLSPTWGLNDDSHRFLLRLGVSYEFSHVGRR